LEDFHFDKKRLTQISNEVTYNVNHRHLLFFVYISDFFKL